MKHRWMKKQELLAIAWMLSVGCGSASSKSDDPVVLAGSGGVPNAGAGGVAASGTGGIGSTGGGGTGGVGGAAGMITAGEGGDGGGEAGTGGPLPIPTGACAETAAGIYAVRAIIPVYWDNLTDQGVMKTSAAGRGEIVAHVRFEITALNGDTGEYTATSRICGVQLPSTIIPILGEAVQPIYPDDLWEKMPEKEVSGAFSGFEPGATFTLPRSVRLMGISLSGEDEPWPTSAMTATFSCPEGTGVQCFPDHDMDGHPGISNFFKREGVGPFECGRDLFTQEPSMECIYAPAPLQSIATIIPGAPRAKSLYMATRSAVEATFTLGESCTSGVGTGRGEYFQSRSYSCLAETDGMEIGECAADQQTFIDTNLPIYVPLAAGEVPPVAILDKAASEGPKFAYTRLGEPGGGADCAAVRGATFPQ